MPRRTARLRLTALFGALYFASGLALLCATYALFQHASSYTTPALPKVPHTSAVTSLNLLKTPKARFAPSGVNVSPHNGTVQVLHAPSGLPLAQDYLGKAKRALTPGAAGTLIVGAPLIAHIKNEITNAQHQLTYGQNQLAAAERRLTRIGAAQAAQRASDSHELLVNSGIALAIVAALALALGWLIAGRTLRPIRTITRAARRISARNLNERLALSGPRDELKELGDTLDGLFGRLDTAFEAQRHFVANASHELKTPLTAERALLQVALDDPDTTTAAWRATATDVLASNEEQSRLIEALLTLAHSEGELAATDNVDLGAVAAQAVVDVGGEAGRRGIEVNLTTLAARADGDPLLIRRLVANLLTNAVRHNTRGGFVEVATAEEDGRAVLTVENSGPTISPDDVDRLFHPFERLETRRTHHGTGHGLGLSIARAIATAHHATIDALPRTDGGLVMRVTFPPAEAVDGAGMAALTASR